MGLTGGDLRIRAQRRDGRTLKQCAQRHRNTDVKRGEKIRSRHGPGCVKCRFRLCKADRRLGFGKRGQKGVRKHIFRHGAAVIRIRKKSLRQHVELCQTDFHVRQHYRKVIGLSDTGLVTGHKERHRRRSPAVGTDKLAERDDGLIFKAVRKLRQQPVFSGGRQAGDRVFIHLPQTGRQLDFRQLLCRKQLVLQKFRKFVLQECRQRFILPQLGQQLHLQVI